MADLIVTAVQVQAATSGAQFDTALSGEAITAGEPLYLDAADGGKAKLGDSNDSNKAVIVGVSVSEAPAAGQQITYQKTGTLVMGAGAAPAAGEAYFLSDTAGGIAPAADPAAGEYMSLIGIGSSTTSNAIELHIWNSGLVHA